MHQFGDPGLVVRVEVPHDSLEVDDQNRLVTVRGPLFELELRGIGVDVHVHHFLEDCLVDCVLRLEV